MPTRQLAIATALVFVACGESGGDKNCSDFSCQRDAQAWHNGHPGDGLDADNDGIACEHLPNCAVLAGWYSGANTDSGAALDILLEPVAASDSPAPPSQVAGLLLWGAQPSELAMISSGEIVGGILFMSAVLVAPSAQAHPIGIDDQGLVVFGLILDLRAGTGAIVGADQPVLDHPPPLGEFLVLRTPRMP